MSRMHGHPWRWFCALLGVCTSLAVQAGGELSLAEVQRLALDHQPLLEAESAQGAAARERAVAARQLPDPQLKFGVQNLPVDSADAWRLNRDSMTQSTVGVSQELPLPGKRQLGGEVESLNADVSDARLAAMTRAVQRDAGLAFLDVLHPHHAAALVQLQLQEARRADEAAAIAYRTGRGSQADALAAQAAVGMLEDKAAGYAQDYAAARESLQRWTGAIQDAIPREPSALAVPSLPVLLDSLASHPEWIAANRAVDRAELARRQARQEKRPDINVELDYGYRSDYSDMVSLQVGIPLPLFTANRQNRDIAAAGRGVDAALADREDLRRRLVAELSASYRQWQGLGERIDRYGREVIPPLRQGVDASLQAYRSGAGSFAAIVQARQALLEGQLSLLDLQMQQLRQALQLRYFAPEASHD